MNWRLTSLRWMRESPNNWIGCVVRRNRGEESRILPTADQPGVRHQHQQLGRRLNPPNFYGFAAATHYPRQSVRRIHIIRLTTPAAAYRVGTQYIILRR